MPFDESLADRVRPKLANLKQFAEKKMFGGIGFLLAGNMCVGVWKHYLIARIGPQNYDEALARPHVKEFDITGRAMRGWVMIEPKGVSDETDLAEWVHRAVEFVRRLPQK
jgi:TfoX/Sxy family transcriptional regulator of competence genes